MFGREEKTSEDLLKDFKKYYKRLQSNNKDEKIKKVEMAKLLESGRATLYIWIKLYEGKEV